MSWLFWNPWKPDSPCRSGFLPYGLFRGRVLCVGSQQCGRAGTWLLLNMSPKPGLPTSHCLLHALLWACCPLHPTVTQAASGCQWHAFNALTCDPLGNHSPALVFLLSPTLTLFLSTDTRKWPVGCTWGRLCGRSWSTWPSRVSSSAARFQNVSGPGASLKPSSCLRLKGDSWSISPAWCKRSYIGTCCCITRLQQIWNLKIESKGLAGPRVASWGCSHSPATSVLSTQLRSQKLVWALRFLNGYGRVRLG